MNFKNAAELLALCEAKNCHISDIMLDREIVGRETNREAVLARMQHALEIMKASTRTAVERPVRSMGGLIGGEATALFRHLNAGNTACGALVSRGITYAMGVLEVNAGMGLIVSSPTPCSSGVIPGVLLTLQEEFGLFDDQLVMALLNAGAVGYLAMRNATVEGSVAGCQAEVGIAAAMAASAATELLGGTPPQCLSAASTALMNMLGLVCDPVAGLVEYPCQVRNASAVGNALIAAELTLAGVKQLIPFDEMLDIMYRVGRCLPADLRGTARGGCAMSPTACAACAKGSSRELMKSSQKR